MSATLAALITANTYIGADWEWFLLAEVWSIGTEDDRATLLVFAHEARVLEVVHQVLLALNAGIRYDADLLAVELFPLAIVKLGIEHWDDLIVDKVDKRVTNITLVLEIDG